jgi:hypothetical protein
LLLAHWRDPCGWLVHTHSNILLEY